jgi:hypothetical protein
MGQEIASLVRICLNRQEDIHILSSTLHATAIERERQHSSKQSSLPHCNATPTRPMSLASSHVTPYHTSTASAHAAIRLCTATPSEPTVCRSTCAALGQTLIGARICVSHADQRCDHRCDHRCGGGVAFGLLVGIAKNTRIAQ